MKIITIILLLGVIVSVNLFLSAKAETNVVSNGLLVTQNPTPTVTLTASLILRTQTPDMPVSETSSAKIPEATNSVTVIPNPFGNKLTFRVIVLSPSDVKIKIFDHFYSPITTLEKRGSSWFDILWNLRTVDDGFYYYETEINDLKTGVVSNLPLQKFIVNK
jgi:hypothetical protein